MDLKSSKPRKLMKRGTALIGVVALVAIVVMLLGGKPLIVLFGRQFLGAYHPLIILMAVPFIGIFSFPLSPMLYALGRSDGPLKAKLLGSAIFFVTIAPLSFAWHVTGAAVALVLANLANALAIMIQLGGERRRLRAA